MGEAPREPIDQAPAAQGIGESHIQSRRTPPWLKDSMRRFARKLRDEIAAEDQSTDAPEPPPFVFSTQCGATAANQSATGGLTYHPSAT